MKISRRQFVGALAAPLILVGPAEARPQSFRLRAAPGKAPLVAPKGPPTQAWLYNGMSPGPVIRARQGDTLRVEVENALNEETTVHWHGLRIPVEVDGVPVLSQDPIPPGTTYPYDLSFADAGTFWYHPHFNSSEQVGRGLHGVLIVDEPEEVVRGLDADRDLLWTVGDWRLDRQAQIAPFKQFHDLSHGGRFGNVVTVNGSIDATERVRAGERIRLRLANVANARTFRPSFKGLNAWLIALDGHPVAPVELGDEGVLLGAGQRADLIIDMTMKPGESVAVVDDAFGEEYKYRLMNFEASEEPARPAERRDPPNALPPNPVPKPSLTDARQHSIVFEGGAMGGLDGARLMVGTMSEGRFLSMRDMAQLGWFWSINGLIAGDVYSSQPVLDLELGGSHVVEFVNNTAFPHPIHLHGHSFFVLGPDGRNLDGAPVRDTVLMGPGEATKIAFIADNPGPWMLHCHILEHQEAGMMGIVMVS